MNEIISKFATDANSKLAARQRVLDLRARLQQAELEALTKQTQAAQEAAKNDPGSICVGSAR